MYRGELASCREQLVCCSAAVRGGDKDQALSRVLTLAQCTPPATATAAGYLDTAPVIGRIIIFPVDYSVILYCRMPISCQ